MFRFCENRKNSLGGGSLLDLGIYTIQFCQLVFQKEPISIKATGLLNDDGIDMDVEAELNYGNNKVGKIKTSFLEHLTNSAKIIGTKGTMTVSSSFKFLKRLNFGIQAHSFSFRFQHFGHQPQSLTMMVRKKHSQNQP